MGGLLTPPARLPRARALCSRRCMDATGQPRQESEILTIEVKPGWKKGTKITFQEKGEAQRCSCGNAPPCTQQLVV